MIARASGKDFIEHLSERIWKPLGMDQEADMMIDSLGTPFQPAVESVAARCSPLWSNPAATGPVAGRAGDSGVCRRLNQRRGDPPIRRCGIHNLARWQLSQSVVGAYNENGAYSARGIHGQAIYIDPTAEMVIARFATYPISFNAAIDPTSLPAYQAVADYLLTK